MGQVQESVPPPAGAPQPAGEPRPADEERLAGEVRPPAARRSAAIAPYRHLIRWAIRLVLLLALIAGVFAGIAWTRGASERERVAALARDFLEAKADRDAEEACEQLSRGQQQDVVARVGDLAMSSAAAEDCQNYVLRTSPRSNFTSWQLGALAKGDLEVHVSEVGDGDMRVARLTRPGSREPEIRAWKRDLEWKLDGSAYLGAAFVQGCVGPGRSQSRCACVFDELRAKNPGHPEALQNRVAVELESARAGGSASLLAAANQACGIAPG